MQRVKLFKGLETEVEALEQQINACRTEQMKADAWKYESSELLSMTVYVRHQSRGMPISVAMRSTTRPTAGAATQPPVA